MAKDRLFLLKPDFHDSGKGPYCPDGVAIEGLLSYYPKLRTQLEVSYVDFPRPRVPLATELGPDNQGCPVLIFGDDAAAGKAAGLAVRRAQGKAFLSEPADIRAYLSMAYGIGTAH
jgi:hypothetical protein